MSKKIRHPEKVNKPINPIKKKPEWIRSKIIDTQVFLSGFSLRKNDPRIADNIGAVAIIIKVLATLVFWIETTKAILVTEKVKT